MFLEPEEQCSSHIKVFSHTRSRKENEGCGEKRKEAEFSSGIFSWLFQASAGVVGKKERILNLFPALPRNSPAEKREIQIVKTASEKRKRNYWT